MSATIPMNTRANRRAIMSTGRNSLENTKCRLAPHYLESMSNIVFVYFSNLNRGVVYYDIIHMSFYVDKFYIESEGEQGKVGEPAQIKK